MLALYWPHPALSWCQHGAWQTQLPRTNHSVSPEHPHLPQLPGTGHLPGYQRSEAESRERGCDWSCQKLGSQLPLPGVSREPSASEAQPSKVGGALSEMDHHLKGPTPSPWSSEARRQLTRCSGQNIRTGVSSLSRLAFPEPTQSLAKFTCMSTFLPLTSGPGNFFSHHP